MTRKQRREAYQFARKAAKGSMDSGNRWDRIQETIQGKPETSAMTWSAAYSATQAEGRIDFAIIQRAGSKQVSPRSPNWYRTVRTDTTDRLSISRRALATRKRL